MGRLHRELLRAVLGFVTRPRLTLALTAIVLTASVWLAISKLTISADQNKLFDPHVQFFRDYLNFNENFPENEAVYVVVRPSSPGTMPPVQRWGEVADAIINRLAGMKKVVQSVDGRVPADKLGKQGLVFDGPNRVRQSFADVKQFIPLIKVVVEKDFFKSIVLGGTPLERLISSLERAPPDKDTLPFLSVLANSWEYTVSHDATLRPSAGLPDLNALDASDPSRLGYYYVPDELDPAQHLLLVRIYPKSSYDSLTAVSEIIESIDAGVRDAAKPFPEFNVGLTGRPALDADEMRITDQDTRRAEVLALVSVFIGLVVALRSIWLALVGEFALGVGIGWTFGWATLTVGELNLLSIVFLLALIGIGMDYLVQILTRYRLEASRRSDPRRIWVAVFRHVSAPINTACLGAAGAFLVSALTGFRGAAQLGIIAGGGLVLCLIAGYVILPPLLTLLPIRRRRRAILMALKSKPDRPAVRWLRLGLPIVWCAALVAGREYAFRTHFDPNLLSLQAPDHESVELVRHLQTWSAVVLSRDFNVLRNVRTAVSASPLVQSTDSLLNTFDNLDFLRPHAGELPTIRWDELKAITPGTLSSLSKKSRALADKIAPADGGAAMVLKRFAKTMDDAGEADRDRMAARLTEWQAGFIQQMRESLASFSIKSLDIESLPDELRSHFVGLDGQFALYIYPKADLWEQANLVAFASDIETRMAKVPGAPAATGIAINLYHSTASIESSFYHAAAYALGLVVLLVLIDLRHIRLTILAISVLAFGLPMLIIAMGLLGVDWNFANFFALPILIGAGHEYGVFLVHRYTEARDFPRRTWGRWDTSDRALLLCAYVTCASFGFFWAMASHRGLKSLGLVMTLGTACIYLASFMVVRPLLKWQLGWRNR